MTRYALLSTALVFLSGCDAASEIAGDTIQTGMRTEIVAQCEQVAANAGIAADRVSAVCKCTADDFMSEAKAGMLGGERPSIQGIEGIVNACVAKTDPDGVGR